MFSWKITTRCLIGVAVRALAAASWSSPAAESAGTSATAAAASVSIERIPRIASLHPPTKQASWGPRIHPTKQAFVGTPEKVAEPRLGAAPGEATIGADKRG